MSRDHTKLRVFHEAHRLVTSIYRHTNEFPRDEWFGLRMQMRRAAVSIPVNLVEGNARRTMREYCNFLNIALGSACELAYLVLLARELGFIEEEDLKQRREPSSDRRNASWSRWRRCAIGTMRAAIVLAGPNVNG